jgi:ParB-like chromosome segregation protein Spo0J
MVLVPDEGFQPHPAADIFPRMSDDEMQELVADVEKNGLQQRIDLCDGMILDGRNRYEALIRLGRHENGALFNDMTDGFRMNQDRIVPFVLSRNLHRRHLSPSQRSMVADELEKVEAKLARERKVEAGKAARQKQLGVVENLPQPQEQGRARDKAGERMNVSGRLVDMAGKVADRGVPELQTAVRNGEVAVSSAAAIVDLPPEEQREAVAGGKKGVAEAAKEAKASKKKPACGVLCAEEAIKRLEKVPLDDPQREEGLQLVQEWINENRKPKEQK